MDPFFLLATTGIHQKLKLMYLKKQNKYYITDTKITNLKVIMRRKPQTPNLTYTTISILKLCVLWIWCFKTSTIPPLCLPLFLSVVPFHTDEQVTSGKTERANQWGKRVFLRFRIIMMVKGKEDLFIYERIRV